jgi:hypothetical protein
MKKRLLFLLALSFCDVLLVHTSQYLQSLFSFGRPNLTVFRSLSQRKPSLDPAKFSYSTTSRDGFGCKVESFRTIKFYYNQPPNPASRKKETVDADIIRHTTPL